MKDKFYKGIPIPLSIKKCLQHLSASKIMLDFTCAGRVIMLFVLKLTIDESPKFAFLHGVSDAQLNIIPKELQISNRQYVLCFTCSEFNIFLCTRSSILKERSLRIHVVSNKCVRDALAVVHVEEVNSLRYTEWIKEGNTMGTQHTQVL